MFALKDDISFIPAFDWNLLDIIIKVVWEEAPNHLTEIAQWMLTIYFHGCLHYYIYYYYTEGIYIYIYIARSVNFVRITSTLQFKNDRGSSTSSRLQITKEERPSQRSHRHIQNIPRWLTKPSQLWRGTWKFIENKPFWNTCRPRPPDTNLLNDKKWGNLNKI